MSEYTKTKNKKKRGQTKKNKLDIKKNEDEEIQEQVSNNIDIIKKIVENI